MIRPTRVPMSTPVTSRRGSGKLAATQRYIVDASDIEISMLRHDLTRREFVVFLENVCMYRREAHPRTWEWDDEDDFARSSMVVFYERLQSPYDAPHSLMRSMDDYKLGAKALFAQRHLAKVCKPSGLVIWRRPGFVG